MLSFGYGALQDAGMTPADQGQPVCGAAAAASLRCGKILTTGLTIGSGGSGGVFGPSMVIGGCGGGALGIFLHWILAAAGAAPGHVSSSSAWPASSPPPPRRRFRPW